MNDMDLSAHINHVWGQLVEHQIKDVPTLKDIAKRTGLIQYCKRQQDRMQTFNEAIDIINQLDNNLMVPEATIRSRLTNRSETMKKALTKIIRDALGFTGEIKSINGTIRRGGRKQKKSIKRHNKA